MCSAGGVKNFYEGVNGWVSVAALCIVTVIGLVINVTVVASSDPVALQ